MKSTLNKLFGHTTLTKTDAYDILIRIGRGEVNPAQTAAFLTVFMMRNISVEELSGFRQALLDLSIKINLNVGKTLDVCGTGGDGKDTFNISTLSAMVIAGAGYKVAKHGNYGVSSTCGSSNVLEHLGYKFTNEEDALKRQIEKANFCMMHAPLFHPAMKYVAPVRKELGVKTFFNMLGPLVNPSKPSHQMTGVFSCEVGRLYHYLLRKEGIQYTILHSLDGYDEISLTGPYKKWSPTGESVILPEEIGFSNIKKEDIFGGKSIGEAAKIFVDILDGKGSPSQKDVVIANAAHGIKCIDNVLSLEDCISKAKASITSGQAKACLKKITS